MFAALASPTGSWENEAAPLDRRGRGALPMKLGPCCLVLLVLASSAPAQERKIDFNRQIRSILSDNCFACHGPDEQQRKAKLRLDSFDGATAKLRRAGHAIVPGHPESSTILERIAS